MYMELSHDVCVALWEVLQLIEIAPPTAADENRIENEFYELWNSTGKHVVITSPAKSGSLFFNYKHTFCISLMTLVGANYRFILWTLSNMGITLMALSYTIWSNVYARSIWCAWILTPAQFWKHASCDNGRWGFLSLCPNIMRPFLSSRNANRMARSRRVFNCHLSRACRIVECTFGILAQRFRISYCHMQYNMETLVKFII